jgi:hypothetical protein
MLQVCFIIIGAQSLELLTFLTENECHLCNLIVNCNVELLNVLRENYFLWLNFLEQYKFMIFL